MKRLSIYLLAFSTFWMSTWMVTDIHDWSIADESVAEVAQPHPIFSVQQTQSTTDSHLATQVHKLHCSVCSYDHSGHTGQTLATLAIVVASIPAQNAINPPSPADSWHSRNTTPKLRPPIA